MRKNISIIGVSFALLISLLTIPAQRVQAKELDVVFINPGRSGEVFWDMVSDFMLAAAQDLNINLKIITSERNHLLMERLARNVTSVESPPDYLILVNEKQAVGKILPDITKNTRVIILNNGLSKKERLRYGLPRELYPNWLASIVPDHKQAGYDLMQALADAEIGPNGSLEKSHKNMLAIGGNKMTLASQLRLEGMQEFLLGSSAIHLRQTIYSDWRRDKAESQIFSLLRRWPDIRMIWAASDPMALGALAATKKRKLIPGKDVHIGGLNWSAEALQKINTGEIAVTVGGHFMLGGWALVMIHDRHNGQDFEDLGDIITFPMSIINRDNVSEYLSVFGDQDWKKIDFEKFSRIKTAPRADYDFSLVRLLRNASDVRPDKTD